jgi:hypothetical protein
MLLCQRNAYAKNLRSEQYLNLRNFCKTKDNRTATVVLAIARVLEQKAEEPQALIAAALDGTTESDREKLLAVVTDAIEHHPTSAAELARLVHAIGDFGNG